MIVKTELNLRRPKSSERNLTSKQSIIENCKTKSLLNFNVDYKHFCSLKIPRSIYRNVETMHFTIDFVSKAGGPLGLFNICRKTTKNMKGAL